MSVTTDRRQGVNSSAAVKVPCRCATTANITLSALQTIDGIALVSGDRVLVKNQTSSVDNGIYVADTGTWTRDFDFDGLYDVKKGTLILVNLGNTQAGFWYVQTNDPITPGTTAITFGQSSSTLAVFSAYIQTLLATSTASGARTVLNAAKDLEVFNVKDSPYNAVGDGVANDTAAVTAAVNAANTANNSASKAVILYFPAGIYLTTPGTVPTINCSIWGPGATIFSASNANTPLITFDDLAYGRVVELFSIVGPNYGGTWQTPANQFGTGIRILRGEHSRFTFQRLEGLFVAMDFAGQVNNNHIGECVTKVHSVMHNNNGINLNAGNLQCEANRFEIAYMHNNQVNVQLRNIGSAGNSLCVNNHFDILVIDFPATASTGFDLAGDVQAQTKSNTFIVRESMGPTTINTTVIQAPSATLGCNYFRFPDFDFTKINTGSPQIFDGAAEFSHPGDTAFKTRSVTFGTASPTGINVYWQVGSIRWNNANSSPRGWVCRVSGSPGTWQPFGGESKIESTAVSITPYGVSVIGSTTASVFTLLSPVVGADYKTIACSCGSSNGLQNVQIAQGNFMTSAGSSFTVAQFSTAGQCLSLVPLSTAFWLVQSNMGAVGFTTTT